MVFAITGLFRLESVSIIPALIGSQMTHNLTLVPSQNICMYGHIYSKTMGQLGEVANFTRGQLSKEK